MAVDAAIVGAGHGAQFGAAVRGFHCFDLLGPVIGQAVLQVWAREAASRCRASGLILAFFTWAKARFDSHKTTADSRHRFVGDG